MYRNYSNLTYRIVIFLLHNLVCFMEVRFQGLQTLGPVDVVCPELLLLLAANLHRRQRGFPIAGRWRRHWIGVRTWPAAITSWAGRTMLLLASSCTRKNSCYLRLGRCIFVLLIA